MMTKSDLSRVVVEASYWLYASPHERSEEGGLIMAEYVLNACNKIDRYERALQFYADRENYKIWTDISNNCPTSNILFDDGEKAKKALDIKI